VVDTTIALQALTVVGTAKENKYKAANINVPLGNHNVYAGINLTGTMKSTLGVKGTFDGVSKFVWFGTDENTPTVGGISVLYAANEFPMFASEVQSLKIVPQPDGQADAENKVTIPIDRMVAKVTVRKGTSFVTGNNSLKAAGATFSDAAKWALGNLNGKTYPYGKANFGKANYGQDPNYDYAGKLNETAGKTYRTQNFVNDFNTSTPGVAAWTGFDTDVDANATAVLLRKVKYAPANNSKQGRLGESTYAAIQVKFAPDKTFTYSAGDAAPKEVAGYNPSLAGSVTYYVVEAGGSVYYFAGAADAAAYATAVTSSVKTYYGQYCFYHIMLGKGTTERNQFYALTLNSITGLGTPTGEIDDEDVDNTADDRAILDVTLAINPWVLNESDEILEK
jgi:hypothetical protein